MAQMFSLREVVGMETEEIPVQPAVAGNAPLFRAEIAADDAAAGLAPEGRRRIACELQKKLGS